MFWILQKKIRSADEIQLLDRAFGTLRFFKEMKSKLSSQLYETLLNTIQYKMRPKSSVFGQGVINEEQNSDFFVLLKGKIFILVEKEMSLSKYNSPPNKDLMRGSARRNTRAKTIVSTRSTPRKLTSPNKDEAKSMKNLDISESINISESKVVDRRTSIMGSFKELDLRTSISEGPQPSQRDDMRKPTIRRLSTVLDQFNVSQEEAIGDLLRIDTEGSKSQQQTENDDPLTNHQTIIIEIEENYPNLRFQSAIKVGESYGEASLTFKNKRKETLYTVEESHMAILNKEGFKEILG